jgi:16S rRNA (guanine1516-N2)-methyltransferase
MPRLAVVIPDSPDVRAGDPETIALAQCLADSMGLPVLAGGNGVGAGAFELLIRVSGARLELVVNRPDAPGALTVDFDSPALQCRSSQALYRQSLVRAAGARPGAAPAVLDATAGLGKDAFLLASAGCRVDLLEADPVIHALLRNGMTRGVVSSRGDVRSALSRMTLSLRSLSAFSGVGRCYDVVYLDPMFPTRSKSARVKKDMWILQQFFLDTPAIADEGSLLNDALFLTRGRVVVKRPAHAAELAGRQPTFRLVGRSSRYDVYEKG